MNEVTLGDKIFISSKRAAEITGYAKDYVGQLCREGHVEAKMIGRSWYVYEPSIRAHRFGSESVEEPIEDVEIEQENVALNEEIKNPQAWEKPTYTAETPQMLPEISTVADDEPIEPVEESLTDMQNAWKEWFDRKQDLTTPEIESPEVINGTEEEFDQENENANPSEEIEDEIHEPEEQNEYQHELEDVSIPIHRIENEVYKPETQPEELAELIPITSIQAPVAEYIPIPVHVAPVIDVINQRNDNRQHPEAMVIKDQVDRRGKVAAPKQVMRTRRADTSNAPIIALLIGLSFLVLAITVIGTGFADKYVQVYSTHNSVINFITGTQEFKRQ